MSIPLAICLAISSFSFGFSLAGLLYFSIFKK